MRMSDVIAAYILHRMENENGFVELRRNDLALELGCVPSQINYVLSSRFTPEQGYIVESRRGGGGYIRIRRIHFHSNTSMLAHVVNAITEPLLAASAQAILQNLLDNQLLSVQSANVMSAAVSDRALRAIPPSYRDVVRTDILKHMLTAAALPE